MSHALTLYRLQQTDSRLDQIRTRLKTIHDQLENNAEITTARQRLEKAEQAVREGEKRVRETEMTAKGQQIKIEQTESSLYSGRIQNPKELRDLQNDSASLKRHLQEIEEQELELMLTLDEARDELETARKALTSTQGRIISQNASLQTEQDNLIKETERLTAERDAITANIDKAELTKYTQIREQRRGVAVALMSDNTCDACGATITPAQAQAVRFSQQLSFCPSCNRILFSK